MTIRYDKKTALIAICILAVVQVVWFVVVQHFINKTQNKTTATVIRTESLGNTCNTPRYCDKSDRIYPVYEYFDMNGKRYEQDDRYFGDFKNNNPLRVIFGKDIGDQVTAYYTKDKPEEVLFVAGIFSYATWFAPIYFVVIIAIGLGFLFLLLKLKSILPSI